MNISFQPQQTQQQQNNSPISQFSTNLLPQNQQSTAIATNQPKTVFESVFNLGQKLVSTGKAKFSDYASVAFDLGKSLLKESSWLQNSSNVLARATNSALEANNWKDGLKNAGKVVLDWGKSYLPDFLGKFF